MNQSDSYGSWCLAIRAWREIRVRTGEYEPKTDEERAWASEGPVHPRQLAPVTQSQKSGESP